MSVAPQHAATPAAPDPVPRPEVADTPLAAHGGPAGAADERRPVLHDFSTSVNAYGPAPAVLAAVQAAVGAAALERYPDPECLAPRRAAALAYGVGVDEVVVAAGAAELIQAACLAFVRAGDAVAVPALAFGEYARAAALCGARVVRAAAAGPDAPASDAAQALRDSVARERPRLAFACTPENPLGRAWSPDDVRAVADACARAGTLLVLDQAYDAFADRPLGTPALPGHPHVLHMRSLTKDHALAGVRAAVAVAPPDVARAVECARVPWAASAPAQAAVVAAFGAAAGAHVTRAAALLRASARALAAAFADAGLTPAPTDAHYFVARVPASLGPAVRLRARLLDGHGLKVRDCASFGLPDFVRVAARTPPENAALVRALASLASLTELTELTDAAAAPRDPASP